MRIYHGIYLFCVFLTQIFTLWWSTVHIQQWAYHLHNGSTFTVCMMSPIEINNYPCKPTIRGFCGHVIFADKMPTVKIRLPRKKRVYSILNLIFNHMFSILFKAIYLFNFHHLAWKLFHIVTIACLRKNEPRSNV